VRVDVDVPNTAWTVVFDTEGGAEFASITWPAKPSLGDVLAKYGRSWVVVDLDDESRIATARAE